MSCIDRKAHILKRGKSLVMPRHFIFFDTETTKVENQDGSYSQKLRLGWACYYRRPYCRHIERQEWFYFEDAGAFWQFVYQHTEHKQKLWVVSHQLAFDFTVVKAWWYLRKGGYKLKFFHNNGVTAIISVRGRGNSILFVDSMNWFPESLAKIGERLGIPKGKIDFETCSKFDLRIYCRGDVVILQQAVLDFMKFLNGNRISRLCYTIGSTALAAYLYSSYFHKIYIHNNKEAIDLERDSYRGGRCECFYIGEKDYGNYYLIDVNSLYPFVMQGNLYPVKYHKATHKIEVGALRSKLKTSACIAKVFIETDEPVYAVRRSRTIFPVGRFWVTLCTPELKYAMDHNHILEVGKTVIYEQADIFSHYVNKFYTLRQDFKSAEVKTYENTCKKLLNSLYGKFGQKGEVWEKIGDCPAEKDRCETVFDMVAGRRRQIRYLLGEIWELTGYVETYDSFPAIAAHVTAYGRMYLWSLMQKAGFGNYLYCDTDSLIVNERGLENLKDLLSETTLGFIKQERIIKRLVIRGLKDYVTDDTTVIKGIRKNAEQINDNTFYQETWPTLKGVLNTGQADVYTVKRQTKTLYREYTKGYVETDGTVSPLLLAEPVEPSLLFP